MASTKFEAGDSVSYTGPNEFYPMDSRLAETYLSRDKVYVVARVQRSVPPYCELKLVGVPAPLVSVLFEKVGT